MYARANEIGSKLAPIYEIPNEGYSFDQIKDMLSIFESMDKDPYQGKVWAYTYATENMHVSNSIILTIKNLDLRRNHQIFSQ